MKKLFVLTCLFFNVSEPFAQNVGIGINTPKARLHVADSSVLFSGPSSLPAVPGKPPVSGAGVRMMWYPSKGAFRSGYVNSTQWDETNIGNYSISFGSLNKSSGVNSSSFGISNTASGIGSFAAGYGNIASGNYTTTLGYDNDAASYGSLSIGRLNIDTGSNTTWVETDPLFTIGNGFTYETSPGIFAKLNRNAFEVSKNGNARVGNRLFVNENLRVYGNTDIDGRVILDSSLFVNGTTLLKGKYTDIYGNGFVRGYLNVDTINTVKSINTNYSSGTMPDLNIVPLGVAKFEASYQLNVTFDDCLGSVENLAGNFITGRTMSCEDPAGQTSYLMIQLKFDTTQVAQYSEIIAVPCINYDGDANIAGRSEFSGVLSEVVHHPTSGKPISFKAGFYTGDISLYQLCKIHGTVMFYGIK